jgi:hypothetical protein
LIFLLLLFIVLFSYEIKKNKDRVDVMKRWRDEEMKRWRDEEMKRW